MDGWLAKWRLAWRDLRAQGRRSIFFALLVAAGVASLVGVQGVSTSLTTAMHTNARQLVQGDLVIANGSELTTAQKDALALLKRDGAEMTETWQTAAVVIAGNGQSIVDVKVVDPQVWPFYGGFTSSPAQVKPGKGEALVGPELLTRLKLQVGDTVGLGAEKLKIVGTVIAEPRSPDGQIALGPRVLLSQASFRSPTTGDTQKILVKLPTSITAADAKVRLLDVFPDPKTIQTSDDAWQSFVNVMDKVFTFLSMVALISLLVGGLGVAMAMRTFISQKLEQIAVLKALGATAGAVMSIFLIEAGLLGIGGSLVGVGLGMGVQIMLPKLLGDLIPVAAAGLDWTSALGGLGAGLLIALLSALIPIRSIRNVKPAALFRGDTTNTKLGWKAWLETAVVGLVTVGGIAWIAMRYAKSVPVGLGFLAGIIVAAVLLFVTTWLLLRIARLLPQSGRPAMRYAVRSLQAPGNQSTVVVISMGLGIMLMTTVYMLQGSLMNQVRSAGMGPDTPNLYVMGATAANQNALRTYLEHHPQVSRVPDPISVVSSTIITIDGKNLSDVTANGEYKQPLQIFSSGKELPPGMKVVDGEWFSPADFGKPLLTVLKSAADDLNLKAGSQVVLRVKNQPVAFTVKSIVEKSGNGVTTRLGTLNAAPGSLDSFTDRYLLTVVTKPHQEDVVVGDVLQQYPDVLPISLGSVMAVIDSMMGKIANILRFVTGFAVIAAGVVLSGSLSATRFRRRKEAALLKSLGATRGLVALATTLENGLLGAVAGLAGGGLAYALVKVAAVGLKMSVTVTAWPLLVAALAGAVLAVLVGITSMLDVLRVKPLAVLRSE